MMELRLVYPWYLVLKNVFDITLIETSHKQMLLISVLLPWSQKRCNSRSGPSRPILTLTSFKFIENSINIDDFKKVYYENIFNDTYLVC
jgi:hypothetical protein